MSIFYAFQNRISDDNKLWLWMSTFDSVGYAFCVLLMKNNLKDNLI